MALKNCLQQFYKEHLLPDFVMPNYVWPQWNTIHTDLLMHKYGLLSEQSISFIG